MPDPLVLLHGFTQTGRSWAGVTAALGERYRSFAPDLPGHGDAAHRRPATLDACTAYLRGLHLESFHLCGYSMGGRVALHAALTIPDRIERLTLISTSPGIEDPQEREARKAQDEELARHIEQVGTEQFAHEWARHPLFADQPRGIAELAHRERLRNPPEGLAASLRGMGSGVMAPLWDRLGAITAPTTIVAGERDAKFRALAETMAQRIPGARLVIIAGVGHAAHLEDPSAVAEAIG
jgi:2-succinyl-6-hydroxy-2,4-cyclohexadiene-1-carboxylate synthase